MEFWEWIDLTLKIHLKMIYMESHIYMEKWWVGIMLTHQIYDLEILVHVRLEFSTPLPHVKNVQNA